LYRLSGTLHKIFHLCISKKDLASLTSNIKEIFPKQNYDVLFAIMRYFREVQNYRCSHSAVSIRNNIFPNNHENSVVQDIYISRLELHRWSLEFVISIKHIFGIFGSE
jgi:hypothetical protein